MEFYIFYAAIAAFFIGLSIADRNSLRDSKDRLKEAKYRLLESKVKANEIKIKLLELTNKEKENGLPRN